MKYPFIPKKGLNDTERKDPYAYIYDLPFPSLPKQLEETKGTDQTLYDQKNYMDFFYTYQEPYNYLNYDQNTFLITIPSSLSEEEYINSNVSSFTKQDTLHLKLWFPEHHLGNQNGKLIEDIGWGPCEVIFGGGRKEEIIQPKLIKPLSKASITNNDFVHENDHFPHIKCSKSFSYEGKLIKQHMVFAGAYISGNKIYDIEEKADPNKLLLLMQHMYLEELRTYQIAIELQKGKI